MGCIHSKTGFDDPAKINDDTELNKLNKSGKKDNSNKYEKDPTVHLDQPASPGNSIIIIR